jgi:hypothetical protein
VEDAIVCAKQKIGPDATVSVIPDTDMVLPEMGSDPISE